MPTIVTETTVPSEAATDEPRAGEEAPRCAPAPGAPFADKLAYYRTRHTSRGVRASHLVGIPIVIGSLPLLLARPRVGRRLFAAGWAVQLAGHRLFERNGTALRAGPVTYQLAGVAFWCEEVGDMLAAASRRTSDEGP